MAIDRRSFLAQTSAIALVALHGRADARVRGRTSARGDAHHILSLTLQSRASLDEMARFYHGSLGLPIAARTPERLTIAAGATLVTFTPAAADGPAPFYHFAFNIPENKIVAAGEWQRPRTPLLPIPERLRDQRYPPDVVNYAHWNAHSIFFLDPAGNVVEYIARHDLANARPGSFGPEDILYASEIAFIVDDVVGVAEGLSRTVSLDRYRGGDANFTALGDERGLLLVMKRGRILNFNPASQEKAAGVFPTTAEVRGVPGALRVPGFPYQLTLSGH